MRKEAKNRRRPESQLGVRRLHGPISTQKGCSAATGSTYIYSYNGSEQSMVKIFQQEVSVQPVNDSPTTAGTAGGCFGGDHWDFCSPEDFVF